MLIAMRRGAAGWVAKILFGLLILSFAVWGIGDYLTPEADPVVAKVGEVEIRRSSLDRAERNQLDQMRNMLGNAFNANALPEGVLRNAALDQLIGRAALDMEAQTLGVSLSDEGVAAAIRSNPSFQTGGRFDADLFRRAMFGAGLSEEAYVASLRSELNRAQVGGSVAAKLPPPLPLVESMYVLERQKRAVAYVSAPTSAVEAPEPTDAELKEYVAANAERFAEPERRDVRAIVVSNATVSDAIDISDAEVANRYEDVKGQYFRPATRTLVQALFQEEAEARAFAAEAPATATEFKEAGVVKGGAVTDLGAVTRAQVFPSELGDAAFAAGAQTVASPVKTALGWHVVLVAEAQPQTTAPLDDVKDELRASMLQEAAAARLPDMANAVDDSLAAGGDLRAASAASGLPVLTLEGIDRSGVDRAGERASALPADPGFLEDAFSRAAGEQSGLIELNDGTFVALIVDAVRPTAPKAFEDVREDAAASWKAAKQEEIARERVAALQDSGSLEAFKAAAAAAGLEVSETGLQSREEMASSGALSVPLTEQAFSASENATVVETVGDAVVAAFVSEVARPTFDPEGADEKAYAAEMTDAYANDRVEALANLARSVHQPEILDITQTSPIGHTSP